MKSIMKHALKWGAFRKSGEQIRDRIDKMSPEEREELFKNIEKENEKVLNMLKESN